jgi:hypothetical protein
MDRATGSLLEERFLGPLPAPLDPQRAQLLGNALLAATADATLVVHGAPQGGPAEAH